MVASEEQIVSIIKERKEGLILRPECVYRFLFMNRKDTPVELCGKDGVYRMLTKDSILPARPARFGRIPAFQLEKYK